MLPLTADTDVRQGFSRGFNKQMLSREHHLSVKVSVRKAKKFTTGAGQETAGVPAHSQPDFTWLSHPNAMLQLADFSHNHSEQG